MQQREKQYTESCLNDAQCEEEEAACFFFFFLSFVTIQTHIRQQPGKQVVYLGLEPPQGRHLLVRGGVFVIFGRTATPCDVRATCSVNKKKVFLKVCSPPFFTLR